MFYNYRPISILPVISKIYEKISYEQLTLTVFICITLIIITYISEKKIPASCSFDPRVFIYQLCMTERVWDRRKGGRDETSLAFHSPTVLCAQHSKLPLRQRESGWPLLFIVSKREYDFRILLLRWLRHSWSEATFFKGVTNGVCEHSRACEQYDFFASTSRDK